MLNETRLYAGLTVKNENKFILECKTSYIFVKLKKKKNDNFFPLTSMNIPVLKTFLNELETNYNKKVEITISLKLTIEWGEKHLWKLITHNNNRYVPKI